MFKDRLLTHHNHLLNFPEENDCSSPFGLWAVPLDLPIQNQMQPETMPTISDRVLVRPQFATSFSLLHFSSAMPRDLELHSLQVIKKHAEKKNNNNCYCQYYISTCNHNVHQIKDAVEGVTSHAVEGTIETHVKVPSKATRDKH